MPLFTVTLSRPSLEYADVFVQAEDANAAEEIALTRVDRSNIDWRDSDWLDGPSVEQSRATEYDRDPDPLLDPEESSYSDGNAPPYDQMLAFVREVASQLKDGDTIYRCKVCNLTSNDPFDKCEQCGTPDQCYGDEHVADGNDDEVDALYSFISQARDLLGTDGNDLPVQPISAQETANG